MSLTLGLTGMDPATEASLKAAFADANARLGSAWQLLPDTQADHVVVDMDSMYGPMSWLRLHGAGKRVIGLTSAPRTQTDYQLSRPFDVNSVTALLQTIASEAGVELKRDPSSGRAATATDEAIAAPAPPPAPAPSAPPAAPPPAQPLPSGMAPAPAPQDQLPEEQPLPLDEEAKAPSPAPALAASVAAGTLAPTSIEPPKPPRDPQFADWLAPDALHGRKRYQRAGGPVILIDPTSRQYHGPALLKPLAEYFDGTVQAGDFQTVDDATWARESAALGPAQPLSRLQWYGGLLAGRGSLLPGHDPAGRYQLTKWPQSEREFPKQFRIATAMMKGPATLDEVAAASGVPLDEVVDFVNANLVTGYAEFVPEPPPEPVEPPKPAGLFGRLRGR